MRFLIVDSNLAYSGVVRDFLLTHVVGAYVDRAQNASILRRRLHDHKYDFILADILNCVDCEELVEELSATTTPVIVWSLVNPNSYGDFVQKLHAHCIQKPKHLDDLDTALKPVLDCTSCAGTVVA